MRNGYKETPIGLIPEDWNIDNLEKHAEIRGRIGWKGLKQSEYVDDGAFLIANKHIKNGKIDWNKCDHITEERYNESIGIGLQIGDVVFSKDGALGNPALIVNLPNKATINSTMMLVRPNSDLYPSFLYQILCCPLFEKLIKDRVSGSSIPHIFQRDMKSFLIPIPEFKEQSKIASILSTVDEKINAINERITKTQQLKSGLMQRLLTRGIGRTKFKDSPLGEIPESWDDVKLGDCLEKVVGGGTPSRAIESYWKGKIPWATVKDLKKSILDNTEEYITEIGLKNSASNLIPRKTIIIATRMALGKAVFFTKDVAINQDLKAIFTKPLLFENFLFHWFALNAKKIEELGSGSTVKGIRLEVLRALDLALPPISEQREISKILTDFDGKLDVLQEKNTQYSKLKQGLMQQLLTGTIRIPINKSV